MGRNWYVLFFKVFTLTDDRKKMRRSWSCVIWINLKKKKKKKKVRHNDRSRRKYALIAMLSAFVPRDPCMGSNGKIIVIRGQFQLNRIIVV